MNVSSVKNLNGEVFSAVQDASLTNIVQTNSAQWAEGGGASDTFYIYPGKTTDKEISENSGKDLKLYNSANNVFLDFAGKSTLSKYTMFSFKEITGTQANQNTVQHLRLRVYPNATSACKVYDTNTVNLLDSNSTVSTAQTAYYDGDGNSLTQTHYELTALNSFVQSNSANWGGGSSPTGGDSVLFHLYYNDDHYGNTSTNSYISGATELYFEASMDYQQGSPNDVIITRYGSEVGRANWSQVSSDGNNNYFTASYYNTDGGEIELQNNGNNYQCYVSANGLKTNAFEQRNYYCKTNDTIKINVQGNNVTGNIIGMHQGNGTPLTSFTGSLSNFTANGYDQYNADIFYEDSTQSYSYDVSAEFVGGGGRGGFYSESAILYQGSKNDSRTTAWTLNDDVSNYKMIQCDWVDTNNYYISKQIPIPSGLGSDMTRAAFFDAVFEYGTDLWCKAQRFSAQNTNVYAQVDEYCVHTDGTVSNVGSDVSNNRPIMVQVIGIK